MIATRDSERIGPQVRLAAGAALAALALLVPATPASGVVTVGENSAGLNYFQALNATDEAFDSHFDSDFLTFGQILDPDPLVGAEGSADAFASQVSSMATSSAALPVETDFIATSGRILLKAEKDSGPEPGVPVASAGGDLRVFFEASTVTPVLLAGALNAATQSPSGGDDCVEMVIELDGPRSHRFDVASGDGCANGVPSQGGFAILEDLPAGSYLLDVEYDGTVAAGNPGDTVEGSVALELSLDFTPPPSNAVQAPVKKRCKKGQKLKKGKCVKRKKRKKKR